MEPLITPLLLASTGIDVPDEQVEPLIEYLNDVLEERIGEAIVDTLDDEKLEQLAELQQTASDENVQEWIKANVANLSDIIQDETDIVLGEASEHHAEFSSK